MIFELAQDFHDAIALMTSMHPKYWMLELLEEAVRRDAHFIARHPTTLFQCMWNTCWWYDCPEAAKHYKEPEKGWKELPPWAREDRKVCELLYCWREFKNNQTPGFRWLRSLRPFDQPLGSGLDMVLSGHSGAIRSLAVSPDGSRIASASEDGTIRIWDLVSGSQLLCLSGHKHYVEDISFFPDGQRLASAGGIDKTCRVWDLATGAQHLSKSIANWEVQSVSVFPDGQRILCSTSEDIIILDSKTGYECLRLQGHEITVKTASLSPDGSMIAALSWDASRAFSEMLHVWDGQTGAQVYRINVRDIMPRLTFSPDGEWIAAGGTNGVVWMWNAKTGADKFSIHAHRNQVRSVAFSPDRKNLVTGGWWDGLLLVFDIVTQAEVARMWNPDACSLIVTPNGNLIAASSGPDIRLWKARAHQQVTVSLHHDDNIRSIAFSPDGKEVASGSEDATIRLWDASTGEYKMTIKGHAGEVWCVHYSPDGKVLASGSWDRNIRISACKDGSEVACLKGHTYGIECVAFSPDNCYVISGGGYKDPTVRVWRLADGKEVTCFKGHGDGVHAVGFFHDSRRAFSLSGDGTVRVWDVKSGEELARLIRPDRQACELSLSWHGRYLICGSRHGVIRLWDCERDFSALEMRGGDVSAIAANPLMRPWHIGTDDGPVLKWCATGDTVAWFPVLPDGCGPDGKTFVTQLGRQLCLYRLEGETVEAHESQYLLDIGLAGNQLHIGRDRHKANDVADLDVFF